MARSAGRAATLDDLHVGAAVPALDPPFPSPARALRGGRLAPVAAGPGCAGARLLLADGRVGLGAALTVAFGGRVVAVRASTTEEAVWHLQERAFDLVVVDHGGPGLDTVAIVRAVRARTRPCPVLVLTPGQDARTLRELSSLGVALLARRPGATGQLVERIARGLDVGAGTPGGWRLPGTHVLRVVEHLGQDYATARPATVAAALGVTYGHLEDVVREETGLTLGDWIAAVRVEASKDLLRRTGESLASVADSVGFFDASHLSRRFLAQVGCTPGAFRQAAERGQPL